MGQIYPEALVVYNLMIMLSLGFFHTVFLSYSLYLALPCLDKLCSYGDDHQTLARWSLMITSFFVLFLLGPYITLL